MSSAYDSLDPRVRKWVYKQVVDIKALAGEFYPGNFSP
jgi:hypothetical protein